MSGPEDRGIEQFERVRELLSPTWDIERLWKLDTQDAGIGGVRCGWWKIGINMAGLAEWPDLDLQLLLVHEICHAKLAPSHGEAWRREMEEAGIKAEQQGMNELAAAIRNELEFHDDVPLTKAEYHDLIRNHVAEDPSHSFQETINLVREHHLLDEDYEKIFGSSEKIYEEAQSESAQKHVRNDSDNDLVDRNVAAEYLSLRLAELMKRHRHGKGPRYRIVGRDIQFRVTDVEIYARANGIEIYPKK